MKFGRFLLFLEVVWVGLFIWLNAYAFSATHNMPSLTSENIRSDAFSIRTHIVISGTILGIMKTRPIPWMIPLFVFFQFSDVINLVEIWSFSPIRQINGLWILARVTVTFQTIITTIAFIWMLVEFRWKPRKRIINV